MTIGRQAMCGMLACGLVLPFVCCMSQANFPAGRKTSMKTEVNRLGVEVTVAPPRVSKSDDLEVRVVFTNQSGQDLVLNALDLNFGTILLNVRKSDKTPVPLSPPPVPPIDDGKIGRIVLEAGQSVAFKYRGINLFGSAPPPGSYQVMFSYENGATANTDKREWKGTIQSDWLSFEILRGAAAVK